MDDNENTIVMSEEEYRSTLKQGYDGVPKQKPKEKLRKKVEKDDLFKEKEDACTAPHMKSWFWDTPIPKPQYNWHYDP